MARKTLKFRLYPNRSQRERLTATQYAVNCTTLVCKSESKPGSAAPRFEYSTKSTNCPISKQFDQTWLAYSVKYCKIRCAVWTKPTKRSLLVCSVDRTRFKGRNRYDSFTYPQSGFALATKLQLSKISNLKIKQHRDMAGQIKTLTMRRGLRLQAQTAGQFAPVA
jgi:hypothetical protein